MTRIARAIQVGHRMLRLFGLALLLLAATALVLEIGLRLAGVQPQELGRIGFSPTVPDRWTEWAMRPNVRLSEYSVTNAYGLHEDREVTLAKPPSVTRVSVIGSSVTWGLGEPLEHTIPRTAEAALTKAGCRAQVLNHAGQGYNILNANAYVQTKVHQFEPDAVVVVMDLQMAFPRFPIPTPSEPSAIRQLGFFEGLFKRATEYSALLTTLDDVAQGRAILARHLPFPLEAKAPEKNAEPPSRVVNAGDGYMTRAWTWIEGRVAASFSVLRAKGASETVVVKPAPKTAAAAPPPTSIEDYEARRERELGGVVASMAAFAHGMRMPLYFVTPYGPYEHARPEELAKFSLNMMAEATRVYGALDKATQREFELASAIVVREAERNGARVIDMRSLSRQGTMASGDFSTDGIHLSPQGYRRVGEMVAERLLKDGLCRERPPVPRQGN